MTGFAKIFCLELASLVRSKTLAMLAVACVAWMYAMPYLVRNDGTADGAREMLVRVRYAIRSHRWSLHRRVC